MIWISTIAGEENETSDLIDRFEAGVAKSYSRREPAKARRFLFGQRQFVRRLLEHGTDFRRDLEQPLNLIPGENSYVAVLFARRTATTENKGLSLQIFLEPEVHELVLELDAAHLRWPR